MAEAYSTPSAAPCDDCRFRASCAASHLICRAFASFVNGRTRSEWQGLPRIPRKRLTLQARRTEALGLPEGSTRTAAQLRRLGRREAKKAWKRRNPKAVRASKRAWAARYREKHPEAKRLWREAHRDQANAASRAWEALNRERRLELRGLWHALNRDRVNAQQRARYARRRMAETGERATREVNPGAMSHDATCPPTLADLGIPRDRGGRPDLDGRRVRPSNPPKTLEELGISAELKGGLLYKGMEKAKGARLEGREPGGAYRQSQPATADHPRSVRV